MLSLQEKSKKNSLLCCQFQNLYNLLCSSNLFLILGQIGSSRFFSISFIFLSILPINISLYHVRGLELVFPGLPKETIKCFTRVVFNVNTFCINFKKCPRPHMRITIHKPSICRSRKFFLPFPIIF